MTTNSTLTLALDMSDRTVALHLGLSPLPEGVRAEYVPQTTQHRHERMLENHEWDVCEFSLATYIAARANGSSLRALALFPRRLFATALWFVHRDSGINNIEDLAERRVGIRSFHTTLCVWGLGDLASVYGVPLTGIDWVTELDDPLPVHRSRPWRTSQIEAGDSLDAAFARGELDAILVPRVPAAASEGGAVPLFKNMGDALREYIALTGVFPIMHTVVAAADLLEERPDLVTGLFSAFGHAKATGYSFYQDPNWCMLPEATELFASEREWLGEDPYPYGIEANAATLRRLIGYEHELGLIDDEVPVTALFVEPPL